MLTLATLNNGTIFRFANDNETTYEKVGTSHYRKGAHQISHVCLPARCAGPLGENEPVIVLKAPVTAIPGTHFGH